MSFVDRLAVRIVRASVVVDRAQRLFDRARSTLVARFASDGFLEHYNDIAHKDHAVYLADSQEFRAELFHWEEEMARRNFPGPPGRLLVGGAGGGREAFAWAREGYEVVAFEPSPGLARSMAARRAEFPNTQAWIGRYEELPMLRSIDSGERRELAALGPFAAAVFGWASYSHVRGRQERVNALARVGAVTDGPIALSFYFDRARDVRGGGRLQRTVRRLGIARPGDAFSPYVGFHHWSTELEIREEIRDAGLEVVDVSWDVLDGRWPWIVAHRASAGRAVSS